MDIKDDQVNSADISSQKETSRLPIKAADVLLFLPPSAPENEKESSNAVASFSSERDRFVTSLHVTLRGAPANTNSLPSTRLSNSDFREKADSLKKRLTNTENRAEQIIPDQKEIFTVVTLSSKQGALNDPEKDSRDEVHSNFREEQVIVQESNDDSILTVAPANEDGLKYLVALQAKNTVDDTSDNQPNFSNECDSKLQSTSLKLYRDNEILEEKYQIIKDVTPLYDGGELSQLQNPFENAVITYHDDGIEKSKKKIFTANANIASVCNSGSLDVCEHEEIYEKISPEEELQQSEYIYDDGTSTVDRYSHKYEKRIGETVKEECNVRQEPSDLEQVRYHDNDFKIVDENEPQETTQDFPEFPSETFPTDGVNCENNSGNEQEKHVKQGDSCETTVLLAGSNHVNFEPPKRQTFRDTVGPSLSKPTVSEDHEDTAKDNESGEICYARISVKERILRMEKEIKEQRDREKEMHRLPKRLSDSVKSRWQTVPVADTFQKVESEDISLKEEIYALPRKDADSSQLDTLVSLRNTSASCPSTNRRPAAITSASSSRAGGEGHFVASLNIEFRSASSDIEPRQSASSSDHLHVASAPPLTGRATTMQVRPNELTTEKCWNTDQEGSNKPE